MTKVEIPQQVADYIEREKKHYTLFGANLFLGQTSQKKTNYGEGMLSAEEKTAYATYEWITEGNSEVFAKAWINGYKVGEQLYYVWFLKDDKESFLNISATDRMVCSNEHERNNYRTKFTMAEIEATDLRYKAFAIPVEEVDK